MNARYHRPLLGEFVFRAMAEQRCEDCGAEPGWPCTGRNLTTGLHVSRLIAQSAADQAGPEETQ